EAEGRRGLRDRGAIVHGERDAGDVAAEVLRVHRDVHGAEHDDVAARGRGRGTCVEARGGGDQVGERGRGAVDDRDRRRGGGRELAVAHGERRGVDAHGERRGGDRLVRAREARRVGRAPRVGERVAV